MEKDNFKQIAILSILLISVISIGLYINYSIEKKDWWTNVFCLEAEGYLEENKFYDDCWIKGKEYRAKFINTGFTENNLTYSDEIKRWQLVEVKTE